jgi:hypothetical protein
MPEDEGGSFLVCLLVERGKRLIQKHDSTWMGKRAHELDPSALTS